VNHKTNLRVTPLDLVLGINVFLLIVTPLSWLLRGVFEDFVDVFSITSEVAASLTLGLLGWRVMARRTRGPEASSNPLRRLAGLFLLAVGALILVLAGLVTYVLLWEIKRLGEVPRLLVPLVILAIGDGVIYLGAWTRAPGAPRMKGPAHFPVLLDRAEGDVAIQGVRRQLAGGDYATARSLASRANADRLDWLAEVLARQQPGAPFDAWRSACPEEPLSHLFSGVQHYHWAFDAIGGGTQGWMSPRQAKVFSHRLGLAEAHLNRARDLDPSSPLPFAWLAIAQVAQGRPKEELRRLCRESVARNPGCFRGHVALTYGLSGRWGGSHKAMFDAARQSALAAPTGSPLHGLIGFSHIDRWLELNSPETHHPSGRAYFTRREVQAEILSAWDRFRAGAPAAQGAFAFWARHQFAFCFYRMGHRDEARELFLQLRGRTTEAPWGLLGDPIRVFSDAQSWALGEG
jgi:hypothetical protein